MQEKICKACNCWSTWTGSILDKCEHCNKLLEPELFEEAEIKRKRSENVTIDWWVVLPNDSMPLAFIKNLVNTFRLIFLGIASFVLWVIAWLAG